MPGVREQLRSDLRDAMRAKDAPRRNTIRMVEAAIKNAEIEKRGTELAESDILAILQRQVKQRRESIEQFEKGGREDLADNERVEIAIIEQYLPRQLTRSEVEVRARAVIEQVGASGPGDRGKVMGLLMRELRGEADGSLVNAVVGALLDEAAQAN
ncbi:MAG: GatB/YqeY domain-containing protein [Chloroflexi bacterium]|nr:GatB/YqeY domain-containing protein [Chloroflexota bacterium]MCY3587854.1 GatB/YqeY domain-containing protein [Chloroflexota bacterium]MCY3687116.1 GatB/YqeY domain-containing protein [Chloroflexota bacterium]MDE2709933.1 GatB/YqeY domain-containing protein [Chloroflexota bacterium]MXX46950.1 GatB/YqeY domain-containing protein [Chloroflexota bacterium]